MISKYIKGGKMGKKIKFDSFQNPAKNFAPIVRDLEKISEESNTLTSEVISNFIVDLQNYYSKDYEKKVDVDLNGVTPWIQSSFITYLNKMKKIYKQREARKSRRDSNIDKKNALQEQMQEKWRQFEKTVDGNIMDEEVMKKAIDDIENSDLSRKEKNFMKVQLNEKSKKFNETWESIENMVEKQSGENTNKTKSEYWQAIRKLITDRDKRLNIKMNEEMEKQMISMIDERISREKDNLYYEQVKSFTDGFSFLRDDALVARATTGMKRQKFTDRESYDRYCNLRTLLQEGYRGEYQKIERLLNDGKVDNGDRRILEQRLKVMEKEASKMPDAR